MSAERLLDVGSQGASQDRDALPQQSFALKLENKVLKCVVGAFLVGGVMVGSPGPAARDPAAVESLAAAANDGSVEFLAGLKPVPSQLEAATSDDDIEIPEFFDTRQEWLGCGTYVVDQGQCGDCWAASTANTFGDRMCIHILENGEPVSLPHSGAHGAGNIARKFQQAGKCVGNGTMGMAHEHGCKRGTFFISPQALVSCGNQGNTELPTYNPYPEGSGYVPGHTLYPSSLGCLGGEIQDAWRFLYHEGMTEYDSTQQAGCTPYTSGLCSKEDPEGNGCHSCDMRQCADTGLEPERYRVDTFGWIHEDDMPERGHWEDDESFDDQHTDQYRPPSQQAAMDRQVRKMQIEMMTNGPLHTCIDDYANFGLFFNQFPMGIYNSTDGTPQTGGHCIELIGWGTDRATGMPYWTWKNSWGTNFANGGFARIIRGKDLVGLESDVWVGCPAGSNCRLTAGVKRNETWIPNHSYGPQAERRRMTSGGRERELTRKEFSHSSVAPLVAQAVRQARPELSETEALAAASRVWTRSVRGLKLRVQVADEDGDYRVTRHMEGHVTHD